MRDDSLPMKMGTLFRILRVLVMVALVVAVAYPAASTLTATDGSDIAVGIDATYDLGMMDADTLGDNIRNAVGDRTDCSVTYGQVTVPVTDRSADTVAAAVMSSGAETASVVGPDGEVVVQPSISYSDTVVQRIASGVVMPGDLHGSMEFAMTVGFESADGGIRMDCEAVSESNGKGIVYTVTVPHIVMAVAQAYGCDMVSGIHAGYMGLFEVDVGMGGETLEKLDFHYSEVAGVCTLVVTGCGVPESVGTIGGALFTSSPLGDVLTITATGGSLSEVLTGGMDDGRLTVTAGGDSYTMPADLSAAFVDTISLMEAA